jgi:quercetin dioxygenase-like cupin family protein
MPETISLGPLQLRFFYSKDETAGSLDMFEMTVQPNARMPVPHYHESWDETVYGLSGKASFRVDGREVTIRPGETVFIPRGVVHSFSNDTEEPISCLCVLSPGVLGPGFFRDMAALVATVPPDLPRMKEVMLRYGLIPIPTAA